MKIKLPALLALAYLAILVAPTDARAHRLDEYLQASRISVEPDRVWVEVDLTPGAAIADRVLPAMDADGDGRLSSAEQTAYAHSVMERLTLSVDGQPHRLTLDRYSFPGMDEMAQGEGVIHLLIHADLRSAAAGRRHLAFANTHRPDVGVYLINALIPQNAGIQITGQSRDWLQQQFEMDYEIDSGSNNRVRLATALPPLLGIALASIALAAAQRIGKGKV